MARNQTEVANFDANVRVPDEGDVITAVSAAAGEGPVVPAFTSLGNRTQYLKPRADITDGMVLSWIHRKPAILCLDGTNVTIGAQGPLVFPDPASPAGYKVTSYQWEVTVAPPLDTGGARTANAWYVLYAYLSGASIAYETSLVGPDARLTYKGGDTTRIYMCFLRTVAGGGIMPFTSCGGRVTYLNTGMGGGAAPTEILTASNSTSWVDVDLSSYVPPFGRAVQLCSLTTNGGGSDYYWQLRAKGAFAVAGVSGVTQLAPRANVPHYTSRLYGCPESLLMQYQVQNAAAFLSLCVEGYQEG